MDASGLEIVDDGFRVRVRVTTKAQVDVVDGAGADAGGLRHLKVRVRAAPEDGKANAAVAATLAKALGAPKTGVIVERGAAARVKIIAVAGGADALLRARALFGEC